MKQLKHKNVSEEAFNDLLYKQEAVVEICDLKDYIYGYKPKHIIKYNGKDTLICREYLLSRYPEMMDCTSWKQIIVHKKEDAKKPVSDAISGSQAYTYMYHQVLKKEYTDEEIEEILSSHEADEADIYHKNPTEWMDENTIYEIDMCEYYDINSAYCDALCELFPKCKNKLNSMYEQRKTKPENKQYFNYFCGYLCKDKIGHRKTFNWITQRTRDILIKAMDKTGGNILYANTDGFIVHNPKNKLKTSKALGDFKSEYSGTIYFYMENNYYVMQYGNEIKGSALCTVRKYIDLSKGDVVHYITKLHPTFKTRYADNIIKENIYEKNRKNSKKNMN